MITELRALGHINVYLSASHLKLKVNIDNVYYFLDLLALSDYDKGKIFYPNPIIIANSDTYSLMKSIRPDVICVDECKKSKCHTNKYDDGILFKGNILDTGSC